MEIRKYKNLSDYIEQGVRVALEIEKKINEDLYEDIMNELRRLKSDKSLRASSRNVTANINAYRSKLLNAVEGTALSWIEENLAPGMQVFPDTGRRGIHQHPTAHLLSGKLFFNRYAVPSRTQRGQIWGGGRPPPL